MEVDQPEDTANQGTGETGRTANKTISGTSVCLFLSAVLTVLGGRMIVTLFGM